MEVGIANSKDPEIAANAAPVAAPFTLLTPPPVPYSLQAAHAKHLVGIDKALDKMGVHFDVSAVAAFYPMFRLSGYVLAHLSKDVKENTPDTFIKFYDYLFPDKKKPKTENAVSTSAPIPVVEEKPIIDEDAAIIARAKEGTSENFQRKGSNLFPDNSTKEPESPKTNIEKKHTRAFLRAIEFPAYAAVTYLSFRKENQQLVKDCALAVSAENGISENDVQTGMLSLTSGPLRQSKNPIIVSAVDRQIWQNALRIPATLAMGINITAGVLFNSIVTTFERSVFSRQIAIDLLRKTITDVQLNGLGQETKPILVDNLIKILQQVRVDHREDPIPKEQIDGLRPVLNLLADDVINRKYGFEGMLYVMGCGVISPEHPDVSLTNYEKMRTQEIADIALSKHELLNSTPSNKVQSISSYAKIKAKTMADKSHTENLINHRQILNSIPAHYGTTNRMDSTSYDSFGI